MTDRATVNLESRAKSNGGKNPGTSLEAPEKRPGELAPTPKVCVRILGPFALAAETITDTLGDVVPLPGGAFSTSAPVTH